MIDKYNSGRISFSLEIKNYSAPIKRED